jgi:hypothetical protein
VVFLILTQHFPHFFDCNQTPNYFIIRNIFLIISTFLIIFKLHTPERHLSRCVLLKLIIWAIIKHEKLQTDGERERTLQDNIYISPVFQQTVKKSPIKFFRFITHIFAEFRFFFSYFKSRGNFLINSCYISS